MDRKQQRQIGRCLSSLRSTDSPPISEPVDFDDLTPVEVIDGTNTGRGYRHGIYRDAAGVKYLRCDVLQSDFSYNPVWVKLETAERIAEAESIIRDYCEELALWREGVQWLARLHRFAGIYG